MTQEELLQEELAWQWDQRLLEDITFLNQSGIKGGTRQILAYLGQSNTKKNRILVNRWLSNKEAPSPAIQTELHSLFITYGNSDLIKKLKLKNKENKIETLKLSNLDIALNAVKEDLLKRNIKIEAQPIIDKPPTSVRIKEGGCGKRCFSSPEQAKLHNKNTNWRLRSYYCSKCNSYHVTNQDKRENRKLTEGPQHRDF